MNLLLKHAQTRVFELCRDGRKHLAHRQSFTLDDDVLFEFSREVAISTASMIATSPSLCCGTAGQAFALYDYARVTSTPDLEEPITTLVDEALEKAAPNKDDAGHTLSPFVGRPGIALGLLALCDVTVHLPIGFATRSRPTEFDCLTHGYRGGNTEGCVP